MSRGGGLGLEKGREGKIYLWREGSITKIRHVVHAHMGWSQSQYVMVGGWRQGGQNLPPLFLHQGRGGKRGHPFGGENPPPTKSVFREGKASWRLVNLGRRQRKNLGGSEKNTMQKRVFEVLRIRRGGEGECTNKRRLVRGKGWHLFYRFGKETAFRWWSEQNLRLREKEEMFPRRENMQKGRAGLVGRKGLHRGVLAPSKNDSFLVWGRKV